MVKLAAQDFGVTPTGKVTTVQRWTGFPGGREAYVVITGDTVTTQRTGTPYVTRDYYRRTADLLAADPLTEDQARDRLESQGLARQRQCTECDGKLPLGGLYCLSCGSNQSRPQPAATAPAPAALPRRARRVVHLNPDSVLADQVFVVDRTRQVDGVEVADVHAERCPRHRDTIRVEVLVPAPPVDPYERPDGTGLSHRDRDMLDFERRWWRRPGAKESAILTEFALTPTRYFQLLNALLDKPAAAGYAPSVVRRLAGLRRGRNTVRRRADD